MRDELKFAKKGAVRRLREFYKKNCGQASSELIEILSSDKAKSKEKKSTQIDQNDEVKV